MKYLLATILALALAGPVFAESGTTPPAGGGTTTPNPTGITLVQQATGCHCLRRRVSRIPSMHSVLCRLPSQPDAEAINYCASGRCCWYSISASHNGKWPKLHPLRHPTSELALQHRRRRLRRRQPDHRPLSQRPRLQFEKALAVGRKRAVRLAVRNRLAPRAQDQPVLVVVRRQPALIPARRRPILILARRHPTLTPVLLPPKARARDELNAKPVSARIALAGSPFVERSRALPQTLKTFILGYRRLRAPCQ